MNRRTLYIFWNKKRNAHGISMTFLIPVNNLQFSDLGCRWVKNPPGIYCVSIHFCYRHNILSLRNTGELDSGKIWTRSRAIHWLNWTQLEELVGFKGQKYGLVNNIVYLPSPHLKLCSWVKKKTTKYDKQRHNALLRRKRNQINNAFEFCFITRIMNCVSSPNSKSSKYLSYVR